MGDSWIFLHSLFSYSRNIPKYAIKQSRSRFIPFGPSSYFVPLKAVQMGASEWRHDLPKNDTNLVNFCEPCLVSCTTGCSGGPVLILHAPHQHGMAVDIDNGNPDSDLLVGIVSYSNYSCLENSGVGCVVVSKVKDWIDETIASKVVRQNTAICRLGMEYL